MSKFSAAQLEAMGFEYTPALGEWWHPNGSAILASIVDFDRNAVKRVAPRFTCRLCGTELAPGTVGDLCASHAEIERRVNTNARQPVFEHTRRICETCGKAFKLGSTGFTYYCSDACHAEDNKQAIIEPDKPEPAVTGIEPADEKTDGRRPWWYGGPAPMTHGEIAEELLTSAREVEHSAKEVLLSNEALNRILAELERLPRCGPEFVKLPSGHLLQLADIIGVDKWSASTIVPEAHFIAEVWMKGHAKSFTLTAADYAALCAAMGV